MATMLEPMALYEQARNAGQQYRLVEALSQKLAQQFGAWQRFDMPVPDELTAWHEEQAKVLDRMKAAHMKAIEQAWAGTPIDDYRRATVGIGPALLLVLSLVPPLEGFANPAKLWKYVGLHSERATDRRYNARLKAWLLFRLAEPCVKLRTSAFRSVYDRRRAGHEGMVKEGEGCEFCDAAYTKRRQTGKAGWDCHNMGGPHWKPAHSHVDALGVTAKAIMVDAWRVIHGMDPKHGSL